jgi:beta-lactamase class C
VDDGTLSWNTRLIDVLPQFAAGDLTITQRLTLRDAFCDCSGLPGRDLERYFKSGKLTPEETLTALAGVSPVAFGEQFIYNNLLVAAGGYAAGVAARDSRMDDMGLAYDAAMRERVPSPIGMARSTFDPAGVHAEGDYALPHAADMSGDLRPVPLEAEYDVLLPVRPAGGLWSTTGRWHVSSRPSWPAASHRLARAWSPRRTWR